MTLDKQLRDILQTVTLTAEQADAINRAAALVVLMRPMMREAAALTQKVEQFGLCHPDSNGQFWTDDHTRLNARMADISDNLQ